MEDQEQYGGQYGGQVDHGEMMLRELITAMQDQTAAITALVESNQRLMMIMVEGMSDEETPATTYMDGTPICQ